MVAGLSRLVRDLSSTLAPADNSAGPVPCSRHVGQMGHCRGDLQHCSVLAAGADLRLVGVPRSLRPPIRRVIHGPFALHLHISLCSSQTLLPQPRSFSRWPQPFYMVAPENPRRAGLRLRRTLINLALRRLSMPSSALQSIAALRRATHGLLRLSHQPGDSARTPWVLRCHCLAFPCVAGPFPTTPRFAN